MGPQWTDLMGQTLLEYSVSDSKKFYYMLTDPFEQADYPCPLDIKWKDSVISVAMEVMSAIITRSSVSSLFSVMTLKDKLPTTAVTQDKSSQPSKGDTILHFYETSASTRSVLESITTMRPAGASSPNSTSSSDCHQQQDKEEERHEGMPCNFVRDDASAFHIQASTLCFWNSRDAWNLFAGGGSTSFEEFSADIGGGNNVLDILEGHVVALQSASKTLNGWRDVVQGRDAENVCSKSDIFVLKSRAIILCLAYRTAMRHMNSWTWKQCCREACRQLNELGVVQATKPRSVQDWNLEFRKCRTFLHPDHIVRCGKRPFPLLFMKYPDTKDQIAAFGLGNLSILTVELVRVFCIEELFPSIYQQWCNDHEGHQAASSLTQELFLKVHGITNFGIPTCWRWMQLIGFAYSIQQKSYYVDGHERDDVVLSRKQFCQQYLTELEPKCLRWVQYALSELETANLNPEFGYKYINEDCNSVYYEFHIDYCYSCRGNETFDAMHGKIASMSVRAPPNSRPIEIYGQDESVFSQFLFPSKSWVGPNQERGLFPKSLGEGLMVSAFVSRDTGFGMPMTDEDLTIVNALRRGTHYIDQTAALEVNKHTRKQPLTESPFVRHLLIGASKGGYWNSYHMAIQLEDVVDCLKIFRPQFDFVFMFDHSQGHARKKDGALDADSMSRSFGGKQPKMHSSVITSNCLGPFDSILQVGDQQSMVFEADDQGPWWLATAEQARRKYDNHDNRGRPPKNVPRTRNELAFALLEESGITVESNRPLNELKELVAIHGISLMHEKVYVNEGWLGKAKGLLQVLWERGWIDPSNCKEHVDKQGNKLINTSFYTLGGRKDILTGHIIESSSLKGLMGNCYDFKTEETALQFLGSQLGLRVMLTPKFHCEFAGEGIEYTWAQAKALMRRTPMREKKGRANFINLVTRCLCPTTVLTKERAARARAYICTYYYLERETNNIDEIAENVPGIAAAAKQQLLYKKIEQLMKRFKTHRCALDFDIRFVLATLKEGNEDNAA
ncbi:hypothetical protein MHU86_23626 [Fragilaria crotonensis]|nr:hypothetical protein MHU86_23626 [Fragilaria crotonensis]